MNPFETNYSDYESPNPGEMDLKALIRETAKLVRPDLTVNHDLALRFNQAKEEAENGNRKKLEELYLELNNNDIDDPDNKGGRIDLAV